MDKLDHKLEKISLPKKWVPRPLVRECGVCGSPATDVHHYGATSCYSCRAFFRRTIGSAKEYRYCTRKSDACVVDVVSRTNCKKCRFQKCLQVGMKPEKVDRVKEKNKMLKIEIIEEITEDNKSDSHNFLETGFLDIKRSDSESSQDSRNIVDISALAEKCIIEEVNTKNESECFPNNIPLPKMESNMSEDDKFKEESEFINSHFPSPLERSDPTIFLTFEEDFRIYELLVRKEKLIDEMFKTFMEHPDFHEYFEQFLCSINSGTKSVSNGIYNQLVGEWMKNNLIKNFVNGGVIQQSLDMFDGYKNMDESVKAESFFFSMPVMRLCIRATIKANKNKKTFVNQHRASGTFTKSFKKACSSYFPNNMDKIGSFNPLKISLFDSPWAARYDDEDFFIQTLDHVGSIILDDVKLGSLYCTLVLATPGINLSDAAQSDPSLQKVQREITILIFRYLSHKFGDTFYADRTTSALTKLLADLHICREILMFGRLAGT